LSPSFCAMNLVFVARLTTALTLGGSEALGCI
jgi:hypothetical protein